MNVDRRWMWLGGALAVGAGALAFGVPLATLLYVAALLACPAVMFFGMGMMSKTGAAAQGRGMACQGDPGQAKRDRSQSASSTGMLAKGRSDDSVQATQSSNLADHLDPVAILKIRLAKGEIALDEYERLMTAVSEPHGFSHRAQPPRVGMSDRV